VGNDHTFDGVRLHHHMPHHQTARTQPHHNRLGLVKRRYRHRVEQRPPRVIVGA
jgi:hypothetical protein